MGSCQKKPADTQVNLSNLRSLRTVNRLLLDSHMPLLNSILLYLSRELKGLKAILQINISRISSILNIRFIF